MTDKESRILFLKTKLENQSQFLDRDNFFKLIENSVGWQQYNEIYSEYVRNSLLDEQTHSQLTELGVKTLNKLEIENKQEFEDRIAERNKLHNESIVSGWKRKTFWYIFALGLFGGIYSGVDLFMKIAANKDAEEKTVTVEEFESELSKLRQLILKSEKINSIKFSNSEKKQL